jgi:hypothetical protein
MPGSIISADAKLTKILESYFDVEVGLDDSLKDGNFNGLHH